MQSQKAMQISAGNSHNVGSGFRNITYNGEKYEYNNRITTILYAGVDSDGKMEATSQYGDKARADSINLVVMDEKKKENDHCFHKQRYHDTDSKIQYEWK